jgi:hypothetical protein
VEEVDSDDEVDLVDDLDEVANLLHFHLAIIIKVKKENNSTNGDWCVFLIYKKLNMKYPKHQINFMPEALYGYCSTACLMAIFNYFWYTTFNMKDTRDIIRLGLL